VSKIERFFWVCVVKSEKGYKDTEWGYRATEGAVILSQLYPKW